MPSRQEVLRGKAKSGIERSLCRARGAWPPTVEHVEVSGHSIFSPLPRIYACHPSCTASNARLAPQSCQPRLQVGRRPALVAALGPPAAQLDGPQLGSVT